MRIIYEKLVYEFSKEESTGLNPLLPNLSPGNQVPNKEDTNKEKEVSDQNRLSKLGTSVDDKTKTSVSKKTTRKKAVALAIAVSITFIVFILSICVFMPDSQEICDRIIETIPPVIEGLIKVAQSLAI